MRLQIELRQQIKKANPMDEKKGLLSLSISNDLSMIGINSFYVSLPILE